MSILNVQTEEQMATELLQVDKTQAGIDRAVQQGQDLLDGLQKLPGVEKKDAQFLMLESIKEGAEAQGGTIEEVWKDYPQELKNLIVYSPEDLRRNQLLTIAGTTASVVAFVGSFFLSAFAVFRAAPLASKYLPLMLKASRAGKAVEAGNLYNILRTAIGLKIAFLGVSAAFLGALGFALNMAVNNWNDVFHWGPSMGMSGIRDMLKGKTKTTVSKTGEARPTFIPTRTKTKSAKPKYFVGTIYGGKIADVPEFIRTTDDKIEDEDDMLDDAVINMTNWVRALPGMLTFELQVKNSPFDENNVKKVGTWVTMEFYLTNKWNKRVFLDSFLLGPLDPIKYWPSETHIESVRMAIGPELTPAVITPGFSTEHPLEVVDKSGAPVSIFPEEKKLEKIGGQVQEATETAEEIQAEIEKMQGPTYTPPAEKPAEPKYEPPKIEYKKETITLPYADYTEAEALIKKLYNTDIYSYTEFVKMEFEEGMAKRENRPIHWIINEKMPNYRLAFIGPVRPEPTPEKPFIGPVRPVTFRNDTWMKTNTPGSVLHLRSGVGLASPILEKIPDGSRVLYYRFRANVDGYDWANIKVEKTQTHGLVAQKYLENI